MNAEFLRRGRAFAAVLCCLPFAGAAIAQERYSLRMSDVLATGTQAARPALFATSIKDYRIGAEDLIEIQVFGVDQLSRTVRVNSRGLISLPLIGSIEVAGLTAQEAEAAVAERLAANFLQNPQVSLFIKEFTTQRVTVEGAVAKPGIYPLRGQTTLLITLALAGGQASLSDMSEVMLFRADASGKRVGTMYDVERIRRGELEDPAVVNDDLIVVNRSRARTVFRDSLLRDIVDTINPFSPLIPK
jgi:polysaccharide export outer membrane protein